MAFVILAVLWPVVSVLTVAVYVIFRIRFTRTGATNYGAYHAKP